MQVSIRERAPGPSLALLQPQAEYLLPRALSHTLRDGIDLVGDLHASCGHMYQEDSEVGASKVQCQEVPPLCGTETLSTRTEWVASPSTH